MFSRTPSIVLTEAFEGVQLTRATWRLWESPQSFLTNTAYFCVEDRPVCVFVAPFSLKVNCCTLAPPWVKARGGANFLFFWLGLVCFWRLTRVCKLHFQNATCSPNFSRQKIRSCSYSICYSGARRKCPWGPRSACPAHYTSSLPRR